MGTTEDVSRICKILSVETRVKLIKAIKEKSLCVNAISRELNISAAAVSQHLRVLRDANIVIAYKKGYYVHYRVNFATLEEWQSTLSELF